MTQSDNTTPHQASAYDEAVRQTIPFYETIHAQAVDLALAVKPCAGCWLDTGCGTGYLAEVAGRLFPRTRFVLADPSEAMLEQARERLAGLPAERVTFLPPAPSQDLPSVAADLKPQVITAILCHHYLQAEERRRAVRACYQLLDRGGLFVAFENIAPSSPQGTRIGLSRWQRYQIAQGRSPATVEDHLKRLGSHYFPVRVGEHLSLLKDAGFEVAELFWLSQMQAGVYALK